MNTTTTTTLELKQLIDGKWNSATGKEAQSFNPAEPQEVVASYATATAETLEAAIAAGRAISGGHAMACRRTLCLTTP